MKYNLSMVAMALCLAASGSVMAQNLPQAVSDLGLSKLQIRDKPNAKYGRRVAGTLASGYRIEIDLNANNEVDDIEARGNKLFPIEDVQRFVPEPILKSSSWPAGAKLEKIEFESNGKVEIEGRLSDGREFDAEFAADGRVLEFDADD